MQMFFGMMAMLMAAWGVVLFVADAEQQEKLSAFEQRCSEKGGVALKAVNNISHQWVGCYKGIIELENE